MATSGTKLVLTFKDSDYNNMTLSYNYADPEVSTASVQALTQAIITNGTIFDNRPIAASKAQIVVTNARDIALS